MELKPCPFCGNKKVEYVSDYPLSSEHRVICDGCGVAVCFDVDMDQREALILWNRGANLKIVNAEYGIDSVVYEANTKPKWYHWHRFPIMPIFEYRPADEFNEPNFNFSWLMVRIWSLISPDIEFCVTIEDVGGYVSIRIPYIKIVIWFLWFPMAWHQKTWRTANKRMEKTKWE